MYAAFFGLRQAPFSIAPDPHYLFMSERHREALAHLLYGVQGGGGFVLLTGEIGAGKTTVCRAFLEQVPANCQVAYIFNPKLTVGDLLRTICHEFHIEVRHEGPGPATIKDYLDPLNAYLLDSHARGQQTLLIIDEAQNLTPHVLEQLRLLTNLETRERKLLQIILIGQPELRQMLARPELEQLAQRVIARYHLDALTEAESRQYIRHRMDVAGLVGPLPFDDAALTRIHRLTRGIPRRINLLCDRALLGAYGSDRRMIDPAIVDRAASEIFDVDASPQATTAPAGKHQPAGTSARTALALGFAGGASVVALAMTAMWMWPSLAGRHASDAAAPPPAATLPAPEAEAGLAVPSLSPEPFVGSASPAISPPPSPLPQAAQARTESGPAVDSEPVRPPMSELPQRSELLTSESAGWRELGPLWEQPLSSDNPCAEAMPRGLQCYRTTRMSLNGISQLNRPAILALEVTGGRAFALLIGLGPESATLKAGTRTWTVTPEALQKAWQGEYASLWRTPPGTSSRISSLSRGAEARWLDQQLLALQTAGRLDAAASSSTQRIQAFQRSHGIEPNSNGIPLTYMQVNRLSGVDEPQLAAP